MIYGRNIPIEVLALDFDIAHAIARLPLALLTVGFFLLCTHGGCFLKIVEAWKGEAQKWPNFFSWAGTLEAWHRQFRSRRDHRTPPHCLYRRHIIAMPPRISVRAPWALHSAAAPLNGCANSLCGRTFSSTPSAQALGPQSPNYIEVPKPLQPSYPAKPAVKGHLPIPRDIFKTRNIHPKESEIFISRSTRAPKNAKVPGPYSRDADYRLYKQRLAEKRRTALQEGVKELHERKVTSDAQYLSKIQAIGAYRREVAMAPPREVDVLTQTSVAKGIRDFLTDALPPRPDIMKARRSAYERRVKKIQDVRTSRLHDLYTNARTFIVDEQQLDEAIEKTFGTEDLPMGWDMKGNMGPRNEGKEGLSPWQGPLPEGVGERLQKLKGGEGVGLAKERVKRVAEELTGGKM